MAPRWRCSPPAPSVLRALLLSAAVTAVSSGEPQQCLGALKEVNDCERRTMFGLACSQDSVLNGIKQLHMCFSKGQCQRTCRSMVGVKEECSLSHQTMEKLSGKPEVVFNWVTNPATGKHTPIPLPLNLKTLKPLVDLGDYRSCLQGGERQYCLLEGTSRITGSDHAMLYGLCRPGDCAEEQVLNYTRHSMIGSLMSEMKMSCRREGEPPPPIEWTPSKIAFLILVCVVAVLLGIGTASDACSGGKRDATSASFIGHWSLQRNLTSFFRHRPVNRSEPDMSALDGVRVISTFWVISGHVFLYPALSIGYGTGLARFLPPSGVFAQPWFQMINGTYFAVDTFFWMSGFLGAKAFQSKLRASPRLSTPKGFGMMYPMAVFNRWLRLTPVMAFLLLLSQTWWDEIGRGSLLWKAVIPGLGGGHVCSSIIVTEQCKQKWWANLLYVNNFVDACGMGTWYLAADMQFFLLLPFLALLRHKTEQMRCPGLSWLFVGFLIVGSIALNTWVLYDKNLVSDVTLGTGQYQKYIYSSPWMRVQPYLIGVGTAWLLDCLWKGDVSGTAIVSATTQIGCLAVMLATVFGAMSRWQCESWSACSDPSTSPWPLWANLLYGALSRSAWGLALAGLMLVCFLESPGSWLLNKILGHSMWQGPAKLSYSAYLVHSMVVAAFLCLRDSLIEFTIQEYFTMCISYIVIAFACAWVVWACVEKPFANIIAALMSDRDGSAKKEGSQKEIELEDGDEETEDDDSDYVYDDEDEDEQVEMGRNFSLKGSE
eukprot:TRINITY_DN13369_c0_g1_i1.p1 TRINITY_DN13369_c0_g1~~TRINITY_DN13369_c0_g1_i1.p1  ORF type:complete len:769 (+),score=143.45 TRINITY_DN13369_c0_g1_i1:151-2457(+)